MLNALSSSIGNIVSLFLQTLRFSALLPALFFVTLNQFVLPQFLGLDPATNKPLEFVQQPAWTILLTIVIGYTLSVLNTPIIRIFEGYPYRRSHWGALARQEQVAIKRQSEQYLRSCWQFYKQAEAILAGKYTEEELSQTRFYSIIRAEYRNVRYRLDRSFPREEASVLPTSLGNSIAAFEEYPKHHYGIDAIHMWSRLLPLLSDKQFSNFVEREKAAMDFMLNMSLLMGFLASEGVFLELYGCRLSIQLFFIALPVAYAFYRGAIYCAFNWGETVKVAFDLYRYELASQLSLRPVWSMSEERDQWKRVSNFILDPAQDYADYDYPLPRETETEE
jgi:hypothetical protein